MSGSYVYHYTNKEGADGIKTSKKIYMSDDTNRDAVLGEGVYFTDLPPDTDDSDILENNYGANAASQEDKITWYIRILKSDLPELERKRFGRRVIYVYPYAVDLKIVDHVIKKRK